MFDLGFTKLLFIGIVALVVIGPERLPRVARTVGILFGRMQRYVSQVKADINREMELAELGKVKSEFENAARTFQTEVESKAAETEREIREAQLAIDRELSGHPPHEAAAAPASPLPEPSLQLELGIEEPDLTRAPRDKAGG